METDKFLHGKKWKFEFLRFKMVPVLCSYRISMWSTFSDPIYNNWSESDGNGFYYF